jgi:hypothetical protein
MTRYTHKGAAVVVSLISQRNIILAQIANDDPGDRVKPRLAPVPFVDRRLANEMRWAREKIEPKELSE